MLPGIIPGPNRNVAKTITFSDLYHQTSNTTSWSFTSCNFGDPHERSLVVVVALTVHSATHTIDSCTIGGVSATSVHESPAGRTKAHIFQAVVSGASGTVTVETSATVEACSVAIFSLYKLVSTTLDEYGSFYNNSSSDNNDTMNMSPSDGMVILAATITRDSNRSHVWSGTGIVEQADELNGEADGVSAAMLLVLGTGAFAVTVTRSGSADSKAGACATWL